MFVDSKSFWTGKMPGDLRVVFHRLAKKETAAFIVGPAVRDALLTQAMDRVQRVDLVAVGSGLQAVERALDGASTSQFFFSQPERIRRTGMAINIQDGTTGETLRRLVITWIPRLDGLRDELAKREVTVNAIAMSEAGEVVDPLGGVPDLQKRVVRPILPPGVAFVQKPVFLLKVAKHLAYHGYGVDPDTERAARRYAVNVLDAGPERIRPELERLLVNRHPELGLDFLQRTGVLSYILPEVEQMVGFDDSCEVHHKDIWEHTKQVVGKSKPNAIVRWAALLHDIGKVWTRTVDNEGRVHFFRHEDMSAWLFTGIAARLGLEERLTHRVGYLIRNHSRINMYSAEWTDSAVRRLARETGEHLDELLALSRADITSKQERRVEELTRLLDELEARIRLLAEEEAREPVLAKGAGEVIMKHFGLPPGPVIGTLKTVLEEAIESGRLPPDLPIEAYMGYLQEYIRKEGK